MAATIIPVNEEVPIGQSLDGKGVLYLRFHISPWQGLLQLVLCKPVQFVRSRGVEEKLLDSDPVFVKDDFSL